MVFLIMTFINMCKMIYIPFKNKKMKELLTL